MFSRSAVTTKSLHSLFLKPSLQCTARCIHCEPRRSFYRSRGGPTLAFEEYASVIREAVGLGARSLHVSGGEPTLYPHLADLIREGDRLNLYTVLNTNGSLLTPDLAQDLVRGGLRSVIISIHGDSAEKHDAIRQRAGNFDEVIRAVEMLRELRDTSRPKLLISTQTIVTRNNYADLPGIIDLVCRLDVDAHGLSYIEGDFDLEHSLTMEDIGILRNEVLPEVVSRLKRHAFKNVILKWAAIQLVSRLYGGTIERRRDMSR
ncbi:MAG TPA: radical SAM protein, partial [Patescibacteria group bacterium]|nr:radical SAM protein [Patescibacteria group bacterium]